jgi:AraC-like DNA-binding protein
MAQSLPASAYRLPLSSFVALPPSAVPSSALPAPLAAPPLAVPRSQSLRPALLSKEQAPRDVGWPSVWAGPAAAQVPARVEKNAESSAAGALLDALDELLRSRDPHQIFRLVVELCRDRLGLREPALLLLDASGEHLCGTWRAAHDGSLVDERGVHIKLGLVPKEAAFRVQNREANWTSCWEEVFPHIHVGKLPYKKPTWTALTPIFGRDRLIGFLENVGDETEPAPKDGVQTRTALLCRALGGLLDDIQRRALSLPWDSVLTCAPFVPLTPRQSLVAKVILALNDDASVSSGILAEKLSVSTSHLSSVFHEQMGLSLTRYRNRLRIERFFTQCDPTGGNLLQAAFQAGFGSYPQFHRVFRELLHATPRDYLVP